VEYRPFSVNAKAKAVMLNSAAAKLAPRGGILGGTVKKPK